MFPFDDVIMIPVYCTHYFQLTSLTVQWGCESVYQNDRAQRSVGPMAGKWSQHRCKHIQACNEHRSPRGDKSIGEAILKKWVNHSRDSIYSSGPSNAYIRYQTRQHFLRKWLVAWSEPRHHPNKILEYGQLDTNEQIPVNVHSDFIYIH